MRFLPAGCYHRTAAWKPQRGSPIDGAVAESRHSFAMTLMFQVQIEDELHQVRVEVPRGRSEEDLEGLQGFVLTTAWLEHLHRLPKGVINTFDAAPEPDR
jgi:hypothetical protein